MQAEFNSHLLPVSTAKAIAWSDRDAFSAIQVDGPKWRPFWLSREVSSRVGTPIVGITAIGVRDLLRQGELYVFDEYRCHPLLVLWWAWYGIVSFIVYVNYGALAGLNHMGLADTAEFEAYRWRHVILKQRTMLALRLRMIRFRIAGR